MNTIYRNIEGLEHYRIGDDGSGWTCKPMGPTRPGRSPWRRLAPHVNPGSGHLSYRLTIDGKSVKRYVHRLVLEAFVGPCPPGMECLHRDGNPSNNRLDNLRWGTRAENCADTAAHGRAHRGGRHAFAKLKEADVVLIHRLKAAVPSVKVSVLASRFGVSESTIRAVLTKRNWSWLAESPRSAEIGRDTWDDEDPDLWLDIDVIDSGPMPDFLRHPNKR